MRKALISLAFGLTAVSADAQRAPIEFKGLTPGRDASAVVSSQGWRCEAKQALGADTICFTTQETIAGTKVQLVMAYLKESRLIALNVMFDQKNFGQVRDALIAKYGKPDTAETTTVSNRAGTKFGSEELSWLDPDNTKMRVSERAGKIDTSVVFITSPELQEASKKQRAEQSEKNKGDL